jgi:hypothetical protein
MTPSLTVHGVLPELTVASAVALASPRPTRAATPGYVTILFGAPSCRQAGSQPRWSLVLPYLRDVLPPGFPIEAWEVEDFWLDGPDNQQARAAEVTKAVVTLLAGGVHRVIWLPLTYNPSALNSEIRWVCSTPDGSIRPAGEAIAQLAKAAREASWRPAAVGAIRGLTLGASHQTTLILWSDRGAVLPSSQSGRRQGGCDGRQPPPSAGGWRSAWPRACLHHRAERTRLGPTPATSAVTVSSPCRPIGSTWTFEGSTCGNPDKDLREERYKDPSPPVPCLVGSPQPAVGHGRVGQRPDSRTREKGSP